MTSTDKKKLLMTNALLWIAAIAMPAFFYFALGHTKFPWPIANGLVVVGLLVASNSLLASACRTDIVASVSMPCPGQTDENTPHLNEARSKAISTPAPDTESPANDAP